MKAAKIFVQMILVVSSLLIALITCSKDRVAGGDTSETGNAMIKGKIFNVTGHPVKGAKIRLVPVEFDPHGLHKTLAAAPESTVTDDSGKYSIDTLPAGIYNVLSDSGNNLAYTDSIIVVPDTSTTVDDTIKAPGSLTGVIKMQAGDDARTCFIIVLGTYTFTAPNNAAGDFALANMAGGRYTVRILSTLDKYLPLDTSLSITAGLDSTLLDSIVLPLKIPMPTGFKISYDTLKQIVTLSWDRMDPAKVKGYNVYRKRTDSAEVLMNQANPITDTFYVDSTGIQDSTYEYVVAAVSPANMEGTKSTVVGVKIVAAFRFSTRFDYQDGTPVNVADIECDQKGNIYVLDKFRWDSTKVIRFDSSYTQDLAWGTKVLYGEPDLAIDSMGRAYLIKSGEGRIEVIANDGQPIDTFENAGIFTNSSLVGGRLSIVNGKLYVLDVERNLKIFDLGGSLLDSTVLPYYGYFDVTASEEILLTYGHEVIRLSIQGAILGKWGGQGEKQGQFQYARQIDVSPDSIVFVVDERNNRIQGFSTIGEYIISLSTTGYDSVSSSPYPGGVCAGNNEKLFVGTDSFILVFDR